MSDAKHSPTPWVAERINGDQIGIWAKGHGYVAFVKGARDPQLEADIPSVNPEWTAAQLANAEFLVKAPNCHYDLLAALKAIRTQLGEMNVLCWEESKLRLIVVADAAIAKAEATP